MQARKKAKKAATPARIFFDMDGTLAEWRAAASQEELYEKGYFIGLEPQYRVLAAARMLAGEGMEIYTMSAVYADHTSAPLEKNEWIDMYLPEIPRERRIFTLCGMGKSSWAPGGIRPTDVLVDDYHANLSEWQGVPVLCRNPHNGDANPRCADAIIDAAWHPRDIASKIRWMAGAV
jgi:5'(3')-deoxyribonucleotidase